MFTGASGAPPWSQSRVDFTVPGRFVRDCQALSPTLGLSLGLPGSWLCRGGRRGHLAAWAVGLPGGRAAGKLGAERSPCPVLSFPPSLAGRPGASQPLCTRALGRLGLLPGAGFPDMQLLARRTHLLKAFGPRCQMAFRKAEAVHLAPARSEGPRVLGARVSRAAWPAATTLWLIEFSFFV